MFTFGSIAFIGVCFPCPANGNRAMTKMMDCKKYSTFSAAPILQFFFGGQVWDDCQPIAQVPASQPRPEFPEVPLSEGYVTRRDQLSAKQEKKAKGKGKGKGRKAKNTEGDQDQDGPGLGAPKKTAAKSKCQKPQKPRAIAEEAEPKSKLRRLRKHIAADDVEGLEEQLDTPAPSPSTEGPTQAAEVEVQEDQDHQEGGDAKPDVSGKKRSRRIPSSKESSPRQKERLRWQLKQKARQRLSAPRMWKFQRRKPRLPVASLARLLARLGRRVRKMGLGLGLGLGGLHVHPAHAHPVHAAGAVLGERQQMLAMVVRMVGMVGMSSSVLTTLSMRPWFRISSSACTCASNQVNVGRRASTPMRSRSWTWMVPTILRSLSIGPGMPWASKPVRTMWPQAKFLTLPSRPRAALPISFSLLCGPGPQQNEGDSEVER